MPIHVKILKNSFPGMGGKIRRRAGQISEQSAKRVANRAKQLVPVDSGELRDHIEPIKQGDFTWVVNSSRPSTDADFDVASYIEYKRQPYLRPALEEERGPFQDAVTKIIDGLI